MLWRKPEYEQMPAVVEALLEQQIMQAQVLDINRYVLESKAFLLLDASDDLWKKVARVNEQELESAIKQLSQHGILKHKTFTHPLYKEVTLQRLDRDRRQHLARRAINALQDEPVQAALFVDDAKLETSQSLELLKNAATHVAEQNRVQAARLLTKAVIYATSEEKHELAMKAAELLQSHDMPTATRLAEDVYKANPTNDEVIELLARLYAFQVKEEDALNMLEHLSPKKRTSQEGLELAILIHNRLNKWQIVMDIFTTHSKTFNFSPVCIGSVIGTMNELLLYKEAEALALKTLKGLEPTGWSYVSILHALAFLYNGHNHYKKAEPLFSEAIKLIETHHNGRRLHIPLYNHALSLVWLLRFQEAKVDVERSRKLSREAGDVIQYCSASSMLGQIEYELGNYEKAETLLLEVAETLSHYPSMTFTVDAHSNLTELYLSWTDLPKNSILALKHAHLSLKAAREFPGFLVDGLYNVAITESIYGNPYYALELAEEAQQMCSKVTTSLLRYYAHTAKAAALEALKRPDEAKPYFEKAARIARKEKLGLFEKKSALELARLNNDLENARAHMQWFEERGLMNGVNITKRYFPELAQADSPIIIPNVTDTLRLEVLGPMQVTSENIQGTKRKAFLALLLNAKLGGKSEVKTLEIYDLLYPDQHETDADNNLRNLVKILRERFGNGVIATTSGGYALGNIQTDAEVFLQTGDISLWRGMYLEDIDVDVQGTVVESLYLLLYTKAREVIQTNPKDVVSVGKILLEYDPYSQDYLKLSLEAFRASSNHKSLNRLYVEAKQRFTDVGEVLPENWRDFLVV